MPTAKERLALLRECAEQIERLARFRECVEQRLPGPAGHNDRFTPLTKWEKCVHSHPEEVQGHGLLDEVEIEYRWCWACGAKNTWERHPCGPRTERYWTEGRSTPRKTGLILYRRAHGLKRFLLSGYWLLKLYRPYLATER